MPPKTWKVCLTAEVIVYKIYKYNKTQSMSNRLNKFSKYLPEGFVSTKYSNRDYEQEVKSCILQAPYDTPQIRDMLVILPFFNPCNSVRIVQNLLFVKSKLELADIPFVIIHCLFQDSHPLFKDSDTYMTVKSNSYAFVKENIANIAIQKHQEKYDKFLVHDGDVVFKEADWYTQTSASLNVNDIVQPFAYYNNMDYNFGRPLVNGLSTFRVHNEGITGFIGHPGYLIAFTKSFYQIHNYPDKAILGGGDTLLCSLALKKKLYNVFANKVHMDYLYHTYNTFTEHEIKVGHVPCLVYHLYHNVVQNRQYVTRYRILDTYINNNSQYQSIDDIIQKNSDGVYEWIDPIRYTLNQEVLEYFKNRLDDEIVPTL